MNSLKIFVFILSMTVSGVNIICQTFYTFPTYNDNRFSGDRKFGEIQKVKIPEKIKEPKKEELLQDIPQRIGQQENMELKKQLELLERNVKELEMLQYEPIPPKERSKDAGNLKIILNFLREVSNGKIRMSNEYTYYLIPQVDFLNKELMLLKKKSYSPNLGQYLMFLRVQVSNYGCCERDITYVIVETSRDVCIAPFAVTQGMKTIYSNYRELPIVRKPYWDNSFTNRCGDIYYLKLPVRCVETIWSVEVWDAKSLIDSEWIKFDCSDSYVLKVELEIPLLYSRN